jgi:two-component system nitrogen regulation response regulator NtrX
MVTDTILIIDDEADIRDLLCDIFMDEGYNVFKAAHSEQALSLINDHEIDLIILDIWLENSDLDGIEILKTLKKSKQKSHIPILMISGHGNVEMAVNAMKIGAYDFIEKPFQIDHILMNAKRALTQKRLVEENKRLRFQSGDSEKGHAFWNDFHSSSMQQLSQSISDLAQSDARVMITGDRGTGKTKIAKALVDISKRSTEPVLIMQSKDLSPDELNGALDEVSSGTLVLQSVDKMIDETQKHLMDLLSHNQCRFRIVALSSYDIDQAVQSGSFRSSLYDRLAVTRLEVPNLKQRGEDIGILINQILHDICLDFDIETIALDSQTIQTLCEHEWIGNIKHLKSALELIVYDLISQNKKTINVSDAASILKTTEDNAQEENIVYLNECKQDIGYDMPIKQAREYFEKDYLTQMLNRFQGNISNMADYIEMDRTALYRKLKTLNISYNGIAKQP